MINTDHDQEKGGGWEGQTPRQRRRPHPPADPAARGRWAALAARAAVAPKEAMQRPGSGRERVGAANQPCRPAPAARPKPLCDRERRVAAPARPRSGDVETSPHQEYFGKGDTPISSSGIYSSHIGISVQLTYPYPADEQLSDIHESGSQRASRVLPVLSIKEQFDTRDGVLTGNSQDKSMRVKL